jgi:nucleoside-diphosphate-sugar epimerase
LLTVSLTGGTGFIGGHLLASLAGDRDITIRALRRAAETGERRSAAVTWVHGELEGEPAIRDLTAGADVLVHLAFPEDWSLDRHIAATRTLARIARESGVQRIVHCSTSVVVGNADAVRVNEDTPCRPTGSYEVAKLAIERTFAEEVGTTCELVVLRPSAVFGPGGTGLLKLARALMTGAPVLNYLRSSLYGRRAMNLIYIDNVVEALRLLMMHRGALPESVYIVADDDDPLNNFRDVEALLMALLGAAPYPVRPLAVPAPFLRTALRLKGVSAASAYRTFDASRLRRLGYEKRRTLVDGLTLFSEWFRQAG